MLSRSCLLALVLSGLVPAAVAADAVFLDQRGGRLQVELDERLAPGEREQILRWIDSISRSLAGVFGHWPNPLWRIRVESTSGNSDDPIPWAQVNRGKVDEVEFFVVGNSRSDVLVREWTGYHEVAHLLIPYRGWGDAWFSEGLASYYQNLLQARSGVITERQMWQKLYDGFMRGRGDQRFDGQSLHAVSAGLRRNGGFMRVYWSGAWYFLAADTALRQASNGGQTLDQALQALNRCCAMESMSVPDMVARLDQLNGVDLFTEHYDAARASTQVPDFESLFAQLDIRIVDGDVVLGNREPEATLRRGFIREQAL